ncbi:tetratricopeptide repeat protein [Rhodohalobacter mucosus]|nr:tetratricopeptide repeat protein [Rhodohalobacter mucosus]
MKMNIKALTLFFGLFLITMASHLSAQSGSADTDEKALAMEYFIQGITDFENEDYEQALDNLTAAHVRLSTDPGINYALSDVYLAMGDYSNAAYYGRLAAEADPENKWYHLQLAEIHRRSGRNTAAIETLDNALRYHPRDLDLLFMKAESYVEFGKLLQANGVLDQILEITGSDFEIHLRKFRNYNALGMNEEALTELEAMRELNPGNLSTLQTISQLYLELGDEDSARNTLIEARERNPRDPQTLILLAEIYINNREWENLGDTFVSILGDPLIYPTQKMELVRFIYSQHTQNPEIETLAEQTSSVILAFSRNEPEYTPAQLIAAEFFIQRGESELALETLERVTTSAPDEQDAWAQRLQLLFSLERYDDIINLEDQAAEHAPNNAFAGFFTGLAFLVTDRFEKAEYWLEKAAMQPGRRNFRSLVYSSLGDARHELNEWSASKEAYEMALRLDPDNHGAKNNYAYHLSLRDERLDYAMDLAEEATTAEPDNAAYLDTLGWIHFKKGNYEEARRYIEQAVETGNAGVDVLEHLGDVYDALGDPENARIWWQKALDADPERQYLEEKIQ